jgi:serine/threonine protein phosphatase PrpC
LNEDTVLANTEQLLWAVADGMGGHDSGDYASQHVIRTLADYRTSYLRGVAASRLRLLLARSNTHLIEKSIRENADTIGCTVAVLSIHDNVAMCSWSGDSRIYRVRRGALHQLTRDHSRQSLAEDRDNMHCTEMSTDNGQMLTSAIGGEAAMRVEHCLYSLLQTDSFLVCTDGLYKEINNDEILDITHANKSQQRIIDNLATLYHERGARDNVGMVFVSSSTQSRE